MKTLLILTLILLLSACGSKNEGTHTSGQIDGTYTSADKGTYTFTPDGKVSTVVFGKVKETNYEVVGDQIKVLFDGGIPFVFIVNKDGSLLLNGVQKYTKN